MQTPPETNTQAAVSNQVRLNQKSSPSGSHLLIVVFIFIASLLIIQPQNIRPTGDAFAYAWMADYLHATGEYRISQWLQPNPIFLVYFSQVFYVLVPNHFTAQIFTQLFLGLTGLLSMYGLCRRANLSPNVALMCTLATWASPFYMQFSVTFTTDVASLSLALSTMYFCTSFVKSQNLAFCVAAAFLASFAILTRHTMAVLLPTMGIYLLIATFNFPLKRKLLVAVASLALPALAAVYQLHNYLNPTTSGGLAGQVMSKSHSIFSTETIWRPIAILFHTGFLAAPLVLVAACSGLQWKWPGRKTFLLISKIMVTAGILWAMVAFLPGSCYPDQYLIPFMPWHLGVFSSFPIWFKIALTGAVAIATGFVLTGLSIRAFKPMSYNPTILMVVTFGMALTAIHLIHFKIGDTYLIGFLPCYIMLTAVAMSPYLQRMKLKIVLPVMILTTIMSVVWVNITVLSPSRMWLASERLVEIGVDPLDIDNGQMAWYGYYGVENLTPESMTETDLIFFDHFFEVWMPSFQNKADYAIEIDGGHNQTPPPNDKPAAALYTYTSMLGVKRTIYSIKRQESAPATPHNATEH